MLDAIQFTVQLGAVLVMAVLTYVIYEVVQVIREERLMVFARDQQRYYDQEYQQWKDRVVPPDVEPVDGTRVHD